MKKLAVVLTLVFTLMLAQAEPYFPGAWYCTKAPSPGAKQAGAVEVVFYSGNELDFHIYIGGGFLETVQGTYLDTSKGRIFTVVDSEGWVWKGKLNFKTDQLTGTFRSALGSYKGKWQATLEDDGEEAAAAGAEKSVRKKSKHRD